MDEIIKITYDIPTDIMNKLFNSWITSTDGTSPDPIIIMSCLTLDDEVYDESAPGSVLFGSLPKGYCTHELFTHWFTTKFIPYLCQQREKYQY